MQHHQLLSQSQWEQMWQHTVRTDTGSQTPREYYGYGWDVGQYKQQHVVHHDGGLPGFTSSYFSFLDSKMGIIVLTNTDKAYPKTVALRIADLLLRDSPIRAK